MVVEGGGISGVGDGEIVLVEAVEASGGSGGNVVGGHFFYDGR
jgi:hypothetical protein